MLALFVPALNLLFRYVVAQRLGTIILSALVAHQAWHWMEDRFDALAQFPWPTITPEGIMSALRWLTVLVAVARPGMGGFAGDKALGTARARRCAEVPGGITPGSYPVTPSRPAIPNGSWRKAAAPPPPGRLASPHRIERAGSAPEVPARPSLPSGASIAISILSALPAPAARTSPTKAFPAASDLIGYQIR